MRVTVSHADHPGSLVGLLAVGNVAQRQHNAQTVSMSITAARELLKRPAGRFDAFGCGSLSRVSSIALTGPQGPGIKAATVNRMILAGFALEMLKATLR